MNGFFRTGNAALLLCSALMNASSVNLMLLIRGVLKDGPNFWEFLRQFGDCSDPSLPSGLASRFVDLIIVKKRGQRSH